MTPEPEHKPHAAPPVEQPTSVPCASANLQTAEVWGAVLAAASERASLHTMLLNLQLVSINPDRAVVGHAPRDRFTAELALGQLVVLFERVLGKKIAVSIMQVKDAAPIAHATPPAPAARLAPMAAAPQTAEREPVQTAPASAPLRPAAPVDVEAAKAHPLVKRAAELLGARVVRITARPPAESPSTPEQAPPPAP